MDRDQTTSSALAESPETLGYLNLWQIVRRRKWRVLLGVFTCLILGTAYLVLSGPQYESTAAVLVLKKRLETRSEEHTSELQSRGHLVCRLLLEKKKKSL